MTISSFRTWWKSSVIHETPEIVVGDPVDAAVRDDIQAHLIAIRSDQNRNIGGAARPMPLQRRQWRFRQNLAIDDRSEREEVSRRDSQRSTERGVIGQAGEYRYAIGDRNRRQCLGGARNAEQARDCVGRRGRFRHCLRCDTWALQDGTREQQTRAGHPQQAGNRTGSRRATPYRDLRRIATERLDVTLDPLQRRDLIQQSAIRRRIGQQHESINSDPVVQRDENDALPGKYRSVVDGITRIPAHIGAAWYPDKHRKATTLCCGCPDIESKAVGASVQAGPR